MQDFSFLTVTKEGGSPVIRRKAVHEAVPEAASPVYGTAEGDTAVFSDAASNRLLSGVTAQIEPMQTGTGNPESGNSERTGADLSGYRDYCGQRCAGKCRIGRTG